MSCDKKVRSVRGRGTSETFGVQATLREADCVMDCFLLLSVRF
jgi:hypothetical protein